MENKYTLDQLIANHLLFKDKDRLKGDKIGPSEIASNCERQVCLNRSKEAVEIAEDETLKKLSLRLMGTALHEYFQEHIFTELSDVEIVEAEKYICSEYINGFIDGVLRFKNDGRLALLEIKTVKAEKFEKMKKTGGPLPEYIEQLTLYMGFENIHEGYIFAVNRGLFESGTPLTRAATAIGGEERDMFATYRVKFDQRLYEQLLARASVLFSLIGEYKKFGKLPDKPGEATPNGFPCLWCRFKHYCWPEMYKEISMTDLDEAAKSELTALFADYFKLRAKAADLSGKVEASEKALNRFFRENGKKGWSSVKGENFVIGVDGGLYLYRIGEEPLPIKQLPDVDIVKTSAVSKKIEASQNINVEQTSTGATENLVIKKSDKNKKTTKEPGKRGRKKKSEKTEEKPLSDEDIKKEAISTDKKSEETAYQEMPDEDTYMKSMFENLAI